jgi:hypothetical protein
MINNYNTIQKKIQIMLCHKELFLTTRRVVSQRGVKSRIHHAPGDFLGFYSGKVVSRQEYDSMSPSYNTVSFDVTGTDAVIVRQSMDDIIGYVNEPPKGIRANVVAVPLHLDQGNAVGYFAASHISKHTELLVHYGNLASRDYDVGYMARIPLRLQSYYEVVDPTRLLHRYCAKRN